MVEWWRYGWLHDTFNMMHLRVITYFSGNGQCMERCSQYFSLFLLLLIQQIAEKYPSSILI